MKNRQLKRGCAALLVATLGACGGSNVVKVAVPELLQPPATELLTRHVQARGVQIYQCAARKEDAAVTEWNFKAPEAVLYDQAGKKFGTHFAGPTWQSADGSEVVGELVNRWSGADPTAVPWLLLKAKSHAGVGQLSAVDYIQRLHTRGGSAPAGGCNLSLLGKEVRVEYSADYYFYVAGSRS